MATGTLNASATMIPCNELATTRSADAIRATFSKGSPRGSSDCDGNEARSCRFGT